MAEYLPVAIEMMKLARTMPGFVDAKPRGAAARSKILRGVVGTSRRGDPLGQFHSLTLKNNSHLVGNSSYGLGVDEFLRAWHD